MYTLYFFGNFQSKVKPNLGNDYGGWVEHSVTTTIQFVVETLPKSSLVEY